MPDPLLTGLTPVAPSATATPQMTAVFDGTNWRPKVGVWKFLNITTGTTTQVKSGAGVLHSIIINKGVATATVKLCDALSNTTPVLGTLTFGAALLGDPGIVIPYDVAFAVGLCIVTSGATDITVVYV